MPRAAAMPVYCLLFVPGQHGRGAVHVPGWQAHHMQLLRETAAQLDRSTQPMQTPTALEFNSAH